MMSAISGDNMYFMRDRNRISGPFDVETLRRFARGQRLARHHQLSTDRLTWVRAVDLLPDVFSTAVRGPVREAVAADQDEEPWPVAPVEEADVFATLPPPEAARSQIPWGAVIAATCVGGGVVLIGMLAWLLFGMMDSRWTQTRVAQEIAPALTVVRGVTPRGRKESCFGVIISRNHVVTPVQAAQYRTPKIETVSPGGENEWHAAMLVLIDPVSNLAVFRADLGEDVKAMDLPEGQSLPRVNDDLYLVAPDRRGVDVVCRADLDQVVSRGEPDQSLVLSLNDDSPSAEETVGRAVIDEEGRFVGLVVGMLPGSRVASTAGHEVRIKRTEAKRLPADHALEPITLDSSHESPKVPQRPLGDTGVPEGGKRGDDEPAGEQAGRDEPPGDGPSRGVGGSSGREEAAPSPARPESRPKASDGPSSRDSSRADRSGSLESKNTSKRGGAKNRGSVGGVLDAVGEAGAEVISDVTDAMTPRLPDDLADELGNQHHRQLLRTHPRCKAPATTRRVGRLCEQVLEAAAQDPSKYTVTVVEDEDVNAYSFVGRHVVVTTGFLEFADRDDDMIRFVLAHEVGHVVLGHTDAPFRRLQAAGSLLPGGMIAAGFAENVVRNSPMSRADEHAADCFAADCLRKAGHSIEGAARFFRKIDKLSPRHESDDVIGALFATHPESDDRITNIEQDCGPGGR